MEGRCMEKGEIILIKINLYLNYLDAKQAVLVWTIQQQKNKEVSAVLLHGTLPVI